MIRLSIATAAAPPSYKEWGMPFYYSFLLAAIFLGVLGQIALKSAANRTEGLFEQFLHPLTIVGLAAYALAAVGYIVAIRRIPVSVAFPSVSASYIFVAIAAHFLWNEPFGIGQLIGIAFIGLGLYFLHLSL